MYFYFWKQRFVVLTFRSLNL